MNDAFNHLIPLQGKRALIFDFDGTVADTSPLHARAFEEVLAPMGISVDYPSIAGLNTADAFAKRLREARLPPTEVDMSALVTQKQRRVRELIATELTPIPEVENFLLWARSRFSLSLVTSGSRRTVATALQKLGYTDWFDPLICAEDVASAKPAPDGFIKALRLLGCSAEDALVFEDSEAGFQAAIAAGLQYVDVRGFDWPIR
jgi:HAD superfamily hydrolase (TIGR01509 family)